MAEKKTKEEKRKEAEEEARRKRAEDSLDTYIAKRAGLATASGVGARAAVAKRK